MDCANQFFTRINLIEVHIYGISDIVEIIVADAQKPRNSRLLIYFQKARNVTIIREMSTKEFGELLDRTDRNIRKKRMRLLKRIREELYEGLKDRKNLSLREKQFLERYEKSALTESEDAEEEEEKRCVG